MARASDALSDAPLRTQTEPAAEALADLESRVRTAQHRGDPRGLPVLGFGEISCVLRLDDHGRSWAAKRLPPFPDREALAAYRQCFEGYLRELTGRGVVVLPSSVLCMEMPGDDGAVTAYCVQPLVEGPDLGPSLLAASDEGEGRLLFEEITAAVRGCVGPTVGLDGQLSNWVQVGESLAYVDVTTPLLRDAAGRELLDTGLFLASLPWTLRGLVRRFALSSILDKYYDPRAVLLDLLGNLHKEQLGQRIPRPAGAGKPRHRAAPDAPGDPPLLSVRCPDVGPAAGSAPRRPPPAPPTRTPLPLLAPRGDRAMRHRKGKTRV